MLTLRRLCSVSVLIVFLILPLVANAQVVTASLQGVVRDPSGAVIPGASVTVRNTATGVQTKLTTRANGFFLAPSLQPGSYTVTIRAKGFKNLVSDTIVLEVDQQAQETFVLQVGAPTQTVTVKATPPLLKKTTSELGTVIDTNQIENLPLNERNVFTLVYLAPGLHGAQGANRGISFDYNNIQIQADGGRPGTTELLIDGIPSSPSGSNITRVYSVIPSVDATQEFKVQTSNYSAQFSHAGSGVVNLVLKSGTNQLHGDVYEFLRNSALDANDFFSNSRGINLPTFQRSQFGFTLGGPVVIPKLYNGHNKTFFFGSFEGLRQGSASSGTDTFATADMRNGNFSGLVNSNGQPITIYDPTTTVSNGSGGYVRSAFQDNIIPSDRINPVSTNITKYWPLPNLPGYTDNFAAAGKNVENINGWSVKMDEDINSSNRFFARFSKHHFTSIPFNPWPAAIAVAFSPVSNFEVGTNAAFDYTHIFSPTFVTEARYGFARMNYTGADPSDGVFDPTQLGFPSYIAANADIIAFPGINPQGYTHIGNTGPQYQHHAYQQSSVSVNNTWILRSQTLNFGFQFLLSRVNQLGANAPDGNFTFQKVMTQGPNPLKASSTAGDGFASFLLGVGTGSMNVNANNVATTAQEYGLYLQDDWRVMPKLTLNIGLRWNIYVPRTERYNRMEYFDPNAVSPIANAVASAPGASNCPACSNLTGGLVFVGTDGIGRTQFPTKWNNLAPRFGFAYQATKNTVIRGAYGIFYSGASALGAIGGPGTSGYSASTSYVGSVDGLTPSDYFSNPFPTGVTPSTGNSLGLATLLGSPVDGPLSNTLVPYSENWNFDIQQMLPGSILAEAAYVGTRGVQLNAGGGGLNLNQLTPATLNSYGTELLTHVTNPFYGLITTGPLAAATIPLGYLQSRSPQFAGGSPGSGLGIDWMSGGNQIYHGFELKLEKRFSSGISFLAAFTGEKNIDDFSVINVGQNQGHQNIYDMRADRSTSVNDISRVFSFASTYQLPFGHGKYFGRSWGRVTDAFLGGWQMNGVLLMETGLPIHLSTSDTSHSGSGALRPNYNPNPAGCANGPKLSGSIESRLNEYFNTACFSQPDPFTFGNLGRVLPTVRRPGMHNIDFSLFKNFRLNDRFKMQFRAESFNLFNYVMFAPPNSNYNNNNFGKITSQNNDPRQMQFALKILF